MRTEDRYHLTQLRKGSLNTVWRTDWQAMIMDGGLDWDGRGGGGDKGSDSGPNSQVETPALTDGFLI